MKIGNVLSLFGGMECGKIALDLMGAEIENYYSSEVDPYPIKTARFNFPEIKHIGDVCNVDGKQYDIDLLMGGSPCQDLSRAGTGAGLKGQRSSLFWQQVRILEECKPRYFMFENVRPRDMADKITIDKALGVEGVLINSDLFLSQNRPRYYWTNIPIKKLPKRPDWKEEYYQWRRTYYRKNQSGVCPCLTANMGTGGHNVPLKSENKQDKLTVRETARLQGIPDSYDFSPVSKTRAYKMIGNGWSIPPVMHILSGMESLR